MIDAWAAFETALAQVNGGRAAGRADGAQRLSPASFPDAPVFQTTYGRALKDAGRPAEAVAVYRAGGGTDPRREPLSRSGGCRARGRQHRRGPQGRAGGTRARGTESSRAQWPRAAARRSGPCGEAAAIVRTGCGSRSVERVLLDEPRKRAAGARRSAAGGGGLPTRARRRSRFADAANGLARSSSRRASPPTRSVVRARSQQAPDFYEAGSISALRSRRAASASAGGGRVSRDSRQRARPLSRASAPRPPTCCARSRNDRARACQTICIHVD